VIIAVERAGEYQVSIFAIEGERGILDFIVAYGMAVRVTSAITEMDLTTSVGIVM
jgi:hypothetical protein